MVESTNTGKHSELEKQKDSCAVCALSTKRLLADIIIKSTPFATV